MQLFSDCDIVEIAQGASNKKEKCLEIAPLCVKRSGAHNDTVHEMARDEARHGRAFKGLLDRYFGE